MRITWLLSIIVLIGCNNAEREVVIVPNNYVGQIVIVYNQPNGAGPIYEDGKRIYKIPLNGILKTQFSPNPGWIGLPEFYYDKISSVNKIVYQPNPRDLPINEIVAHGGSAGSFRRTKGDIKFLCYYIGNKKQIDSTYQATQTLDINKFIQ